MEEDGREIQPDLKKYPLVAKLLMNTRDGLHGITENEIKNRMYEYICVVKNGNFVGYMPYH